VYTCIFISDFFSPCAWFVPTLFRRERERKREGGRPSLPPQRAAASWFVPTLFRRGRERERERERDLVYHHKEVRPLREESGWVCVWGGRVGSMVEERGDFNCRGVDVVLVSGGAVDVGQQWAEVQCWEYSAMST